MKKGEVYTGIVEKVDFPNKGLIRVEDQNITVKNVLPGQEVEFMISKKKNGCYEGRALNIVTRAANEYEEPRCPHADKCGGCSYQTLPYEDQLKLKEKQVRALLDEVVPEYVFEGIKRSPIEEEYRNKMEFSFGDEVKDGPMALGMHKRNSHYDVVTVDHCRLVHEDIRMILSATLEYFNQHHTEFLKKNSQEGYLRHLLVRRGIKTGEILVDLVTTTQTDRIGDSGMTEQELLNGYCAKLLSLPFQGTMIGILHTENDNPADAVNNENTTVLYGQGFFYEELLGLKFKITPFSFFQTNSLGAEILYSTARDYIGNTEGQRVFDLYSGTGTIAQILAPVAKHVTGVEIVEEAVEAAKENARLNGLTNCDFIAGDVMKVLESLDEQPDLIVLDPPRDGIHPKALSRIISYGVDRMVYISCKPTSLARDLVVLQAGGYQVEKVSLTDMFPGTSHVETVCLLSKKKEG